MKYLVYTIKHNFAILFTDKGDASKYVGITPSRLDKLLSGGLTAFNGYIILPVSEERKSKRGGKNINLRR